MHQPPRRKKFQPSKFVPTHVIHRNGQPPRPVKLLVNGNAPAEKELPDFSLIVFVPDAGWRYRGGDPVVGVIEPVSDNAAIMEQLVKAHQAR